MGFTDTSLGGPSSPVLAPLPQEPVQHQILQRASWREEGKNRFTSTIT